VRLAILRAPAPDARPVPLVIGGQQLRAVSRAVQVARAELIGERKTCERPNGIVRRFEAEPTVAAWAFFNDRLRLRVRPPSFRPPPPSVAKPELRQDVERRIRGAAIERLDAHADVF